MSTIHNPVNFRPEDYEVIDWVDNRPPEFYPAFNLYGEDLKAFYNQQAAARKQWQDHITALDCDGGVGRCIHCGNGNVRYMEICLHKPTGRNVAFGCDCVERLGFAGHSEFRLAHIRTHAANMAAAKKRYDAQQAILQANPGLAEALAATGNTFIADVARKFNQSGTLSANQISAVLGSAKRDAEFKARREQEKANRGPVPTGNRITFSGILKSRKVQDGFYGIQHKCLIKLDNGSAVWMTEPSACNAEIGDVVTIRATVEASKDDASFGFAKRPHLISSVKAPTQS